MTEKSVIIVLLVVLIFFFFVVVCLFICSFVLPCLVFPQKVTRDLMIKFGIQNGELHIKCEVIK